MRRKEIKSNWKKKEKSNRKSASKGGEEQLDQVESWGPAPSFRSTEAEAGLGGGGGAGRRPGPALKPIADSLTSTSRIWWPDRPRREWRRTCHFSVVVDVVVVVVVVVVLVSLIPASRTVFLISLHPIVTAAPGWISPHRHLYKTNKQEENIKHPTNSKLNHLALHRRRHLCSVSWHINSLILSAIYVLIDNAGSTHQQLAHG